MTAVTAPPKPRAYTFEVVNTLQYVPHKYVTAKGEEREGRKPMVTRRLFLTAAGRAPGAAGCFPRHLRVVGRGYGAAARYTLSERRETRPAWWDRLTAPAVAPGYTRREGTGPLTRAQLVTLLAFLVDDPHYAVQELESSEPLTGDDARAALTRYAGGE